MLKIAVIEDEQHVLAQIVVNILAFDERNKLKVKPFWIKREDQEPRMFDEEIIEELKHLKNKQIEEEPESVEIISNIREPEKFRELVGKLKKYKPHLIFCDAGLGGTVENRELGVLVVEEMSKEYADNYPWHCWILSQYDKITIGRDLKNTDGSSGEFKLGSRHIEKDEVIGAGEGECPDRIAEVLRKSLAKIAEVRGDYDSIIGESEELLDVIGLASECAESDVSVLILGESGTGKELIAKAIHNNSDRAERAFVTVNCGALTETLLESELFGHEKGAFTNAIAKNKGIFRSVAGESLFLDEIGEISQSLQVKLLRAIQEREVTPVGSSSPEKFNARIITATNRDLKKEVKEKRFREDLYYRLCVAEISLPPLRARRGDVPLLINHILNEFNAKKNTTIKITLTAIKKLQEYEFPGNVRELENILEKAFLHQMGGTIDDYDLPKEVLGNNLGKLYSTKSKEENINSLLNEFTNNKINANAVWQKLKAHDLSCDWKGFWAKNNRQKAFEIIEAARGDLGRYPNDAESGTYFKTTAGSIKQARSRNRKKKNGK